MYKKKIKMPKARNLYAYALYLRGGAGLHMDRKKQANKYICRKKITYQE